MIEKERICQTIENMQIIIASKQCICVSISGGSDSDIIAHIISTYCKDSLDKVHFVFANTGIEYKATLQHLDYLENKYNIKIKRLGVQDGVVPIPVAVKKYGVPFISKNSSEMMNRLQSHGFKWEDEEYYTLSKKYKKCQAALKWWCNLRGENSFFNIDRKKYLKKFLIIENPDFKISQKCCELSKKKPMLNYEKQLGADLVISGERRSEGGARATAHKNCFEVGEKTDKYMPLFFWNDETKQYFKEQENIRYSDCYEVYGLKRTGCVGCPFALNRKQELEIMQKYEPDLFKACTYIFEKSYKLTDDFEEYRLKARENNNVKF